MAGPDGDPRMEMEAGVRPIVAAPGAGLPAGAAIAGMILAGLALFLALDARRHALSAPATPLGQADTGDISSAVPPLVIPPAPAPAAPLALPPPDQPPQRFAAPPVRYMAPSSPPPPMPMQGGETLPAPRPAGGADPALVVDTTSGDADEPPAATGASGVTTGARVRATILRRRATTVPQGTLIPAILETALDSTQPGPARALVSQDVRGFDGSRVLIRRGSRLIGEYRADLQPGQKRALVIWTRLVQPDGVTIGIGSPAADRLGRVGIKGEVDNHFLQRFGAAILQSALDVGVNLASRSGGGGTVAIVGLGGALPAGGGGGLAGGGAVQPTLHVRQGTATTVFVARDLDFTGVEGDR